MAFVIDDAAVVAAETAWEATVEAASTSAETASEVSATGTESPNYTKSESEHSVGTPSETESVSANSDSNNEHIISNHEVGDGNVFSEQGSTIENSSIIGIPEGDIFVDPYPTETESTINHLPEGDVFVDPYPTETESSIVQSYELNSEKLPISQEKPIENLQQGDTNLEENSNGDTVDTSRDLQVSNTNETKEGVLEQEKPERDPNRFSEKNQYATSDQIKEYRDNPDNEPLIEGCEKNADVLRSNMEKVMGEDAAEIKKSNSRAHHIVGDNEYSGESKAILEKYGIDINSPENGIFLPQDETSDLHGTIHNGKHTQAYNDEVTQRLKQAKSKEDVLEILDSIKEDLYNGDMELYNNHKYNE